MRSPTGWRLGRPARTLACPCWCSWPGCFGFSATSTRRSHEWKPRLNAPMRSSMRIRTLTPGIMPPFSTLCAASRPSRKATPSVVSPYRSNTDSANGSDCRARSGASAWPCWILQAAGSTTWWPSWTSISSAGYQLGHHGAVRAAVSGPAAPKRARGGAGDDRSRPFDRQPQQRAVLRGRTVSAEGPRAAHARRTGCRGGGPARPGIANGPRPTGARRSSFAPRPTWPSFG